MFWVTSYFTPNVTFLASHARCFFFFFILDIFKYFSLTLVNWNIYVQICLYIVMYINKSLLRLIIDSDCIIWARLSWIQWKGELSSTGNLTDDARRCNPAELQPGFCSLTLKGKLTDSNSNRTVDGSHLYHNTQLQEVKFTSTSPQNYWLPW